MAGKTWICGNRFTLADILLFCTVDFGNSVGQQYGAELTNLDAWFNRVKARPSTAA
jgi:glutathione S-transferase